MQYVRRFAVYITRNWQILGIFIVLTLSAIIFYNKKPFWNDELYSWHFATVDSLEFLNKVLNDSLNITTFLYFYISWLWAHIFGASELSLRLFSSLGISLAALAIWALLRKAYGFWPATLGLLGPSAPPRFCSPRTPKLACTGSSLRSRQSQSCSTTESSALGGRLLNSSWGTRSCTQRWFTPISSVSSTVLPSRPPAAARFLGGGLDFRRAPQRLLGDWRIYLSFAIAWLSFLLYLPALRVQSEAVRPYGWLPRPALDELTALMSHASGAFLHPGFLALLVLATAFVLILRSAHPDNNLSGPDDRHYLCVALALLFLPVAIWFASRIGRPVFYDRYLMPSLLGWTVLIGHLGAKLLLPSISAHATSLPPDRHVPGHAAVLFLLAIGLLAYPPLEARRYAGSSLPGSDDAVFGHADLPIVVQTSHGFLERIYYARDPERYFYVLDWETTNTSASGRFGVQQHKHMEPWRRSFPHVFAERILDSEDFLAAHVQFLVRTYEDYRGECMVDVRGLRHAVLHCPQWVPASLLANPNYRVAELGIHEGLAFLHVRRREATSEAANRTTGSAP